MADRLAMLEMLIEKGSTDPFHHYARALELRSRGDLDAALEALSDVSQRFPDYVPTYLMAGQLAEELGRLEDARAYYEGGQKEARGAGNAHALGELTAALDALD